MKIHIPLLALLLAVATPTLANDASFSGIAGSPTLSRGEHTAIRMESEKVILTLRPNETFDTDARFVFVNDSNRNVTVKMGFPETNYGDGWEGDSRKVGFKKFATTVNGKKIVVKRTIVNRENGDVWWIKTVSFAPRERKNVRVMATSELGGSVDYSFNRALSYNFTGKNWKGLVSRSDLEVRIPVAGLWSAVGNSYDEKSDRRISWAPRVETKNGVAYLRHSWRNWQAQSATNIGIRRVMPHWMMDFPSLRVLLNEDDFKNTVTFRVGEGADTLGRVHPNPPQGFTQDGVAMVAFSHLFDRAEAENEKVKATRSWDAATRSASLARGATKIAFAPGNQTMKLVKAGKTEEIKLAAAPVLVSVIDGERVLYVPLEASAKALGLPLKMDASGRRFRLGTPSKD